MASMEDRGESFEKKFAHDEALKFKAEARRNKLLGHWAAEQMDKDAEEYAKEVIMSDFEEAGDDDVFRKIRGDFDAHGVAMSDEDIRAKMSELLAVAVDQVQNT
ncbi:MAG: DUF1476 domain-containing protein [Pseudomonadota bacterium]